MLIFPDEIGRSPQFVRKSNVAKTKSFAGREQRIRRGERHTEITVNLSLAGHEDVQRLRNFLDAVEGEFRAFRCRDWTDWYEGYEIDPTPGNADLMASTPSQFGIGNGTRVSFQLQVTRTVDSQSFIKKITKPRESSEFPTEIFVNGVKRTSGISIDYDSGTVTFTSPPANGAVLSFRCIFDLPVRFEGDPSFDLTSRSVGRLSSIRMIELIGE
jgi:uncharacterized protein (TIGR02217 family)